MKMKQTLVATAVMAVLAGTTNLAMAAPQGGTSNSASVQVGASNFPSPAATGNSGLRMLRTDSTWSGYVDIAAAPIAQVTAAATPNNTTTADFANWPGDLQPIAQVWLNDQDATANVYSLRQTRAIAVPNWPQFGGLVIGQVKDANGDAYAVGNAVYFGEWSPQDSPVAYPGTSTDLNMASDERTVWYVGDNAVTSTPGLSDVEYNVVGIRQTGEGTNLPGAPELYTGVLTANYNGVSGSLDGSIDRGLETVSFTGTTIANDGTFSNGSSIEGRFYNGAEALAGIYLGADPTEDVAFGGSYNGNGTITP